MIVNVTVRGDVDDTRLIVDTMITLRLRQKLIIVRRQVRVRRRDEATTRRQIEAESQKVMEAIDFHHRRPLRRRLFVQMMMIGEKVFSLHDSFLL
jgi:hypothetical protein